MVNCRSVLEAATVKIQGATFSTVMVEGPLLPAEQEVRIPLFMAWNDPMAVGSLKNFLGVPPSDTVITFTPSSMASSNAASRSMSLHPSLQQTLYIAMRARDTPPRAVPTPIPSRLAPLTTTPAAVEDVWVPWPSSSAGLRFCSGAFWRLKYFAPITLLHVYVHGAMQLGQTSTNNDFIFHINNRVEQNEIK